MFIYFSHKCETGDLKALLQWFDYNTPVWHTYPNFVYIAYASHRLWMQNQSFYLELDENK